MKEPVWILDETVLAIHRLQIEEHGGGDGIRDSGLLESSLYRPKHMFDYASDLSTLCQLAAAYAYGIARNHPFVDGNKRTAFVVCMLFLRLNGIEIVATQEEKYKVFLALAAGELSEPELAEWLASRSV